MTKKKEKQENLLLNLCLNILIPTFILMKLSGEDALGVRNAIVVALAFPFLYGLYDWFTAGRINFFSGIGIVSILLTGTISLMKLDAQYIAIKEASIPALLGIVVIVSLYTRYPFVKKFILNEKLVKVKEIEEALEEHGNTQNFYKTIRITHYMIASSFFLSSCLNYFLAEYLLVSPPGTEAFNVELGKMQGLSFPVIAVPSTIIMIASLIFLFRRITKLTHFSFEEIFHDPEKTKKEN